jgi:hypothetical protein
MDEADVKLTKSGNPDKRTGKNGSSRKNVSRAREKINTLVSAGKAQDQQEDQEDSDLEITIQKRERKPPPKRKPPPHTPSPDRKTRQEYDALVTDLAAVRQELADLRKSEAPDPVATIRRQILMRF